MGVIFGTAELILTGIMYYLGYTAYGENNIGLTVVCAFFCAVTLLLFLR